MKKKVYRELHTEKETIVRDEGIDDKFLDVDKETYQVFRNNLVELATEQPKKKNVVKNEKKSQKSKKRVEKND